MIRRAENQTTDVTRILFTPKPSEVQVFALRLRVHEFIYLKIPYIKHGSDFHEINPRNVFVILRIQ